MADIDKLDVAASIRELLINGKRLPADDTRAQGLSREKRVEMAERILSDAVEAWSKIFVPRQISVGRWREATARASTICEAGSLNVNLATPALMEYALKLVEADHLQDMRTRCEAEKTEPVMATNDWVSRTLLRWTISKLGQRRSIMEYKPSDAEVSAFANKLGLTDSEYNEQHRLIEIYLNDVKYCKAKGENMRVELCFSPDRRLFFRPTNICTVG